MTTQQMAPPGARERKPLDEEIDVYGLTHPGKVRPDNQDHFLISALRKQMVVFQTSLPSPERVGGGPERLAFLAMVADGVGGGAKGEEASRVVLEEVTQFVSGTMRCYYAAGSEDDTAFTHALEEALNRVKRAMGDGLTPLEYLLAAMRDEQNEVGVGNRQEAPEKDRLDLMDVELPGDGDEQA